MNPKFDCQANIKNYETVLQDDCLFVTSWFSLYSLSTFLLLQMVVFVKVKFLCEYECSVKEVLKLFYCFNWSEFNIKITQKFTMEIYLVSTVN